MRLPIDAVAARPVSVPFLIVRIIARGRKTHAELIEVTLTSGGVTGRGQCCPTDRYGETHDSVFAQIEAAKPALLKGCSRLELLDLMPPGAARNAVDCAMWDLEAKLTGRTADAIAELDPVKPVTTVYTLPLESPEAMAARALEQRDRPLIKIKLGHFADDRARLEGIRRNAPNATLVVDANEGWSLPELAEMAKVAADCNVAMIEQPIHATRDEAIIGFQSAIPIGADESLHTRADLDRVISRGYKVVNIKLDKTGGLTEALELAKAAKAKGLDVMVGCMSGMTLAMAPGYLIAQHCKFVDLDSPIYLPPEDAPNITYTGSVITWAPTRSWGIP